MEINAIYIDIRNLLLVSLTYKRCSLSSSARHRDYRASLECQESYPVYARTSTLKYEICMGKLAPGGRLAQNRGAEVRNSGGVEVRSFYPTDFYYQRLCLMRSTSPLKRTLHFIQNWSRYSGCGRF